MTSTTATILVCEDDPSLRLLFRLTLEPHGYKVVEAGDGRSAIELARSAEPDLAIIDMGLPDCSGIEVATTGEARDRRYRPLASASALIVSASAQPSGAAALHCSQCCSNGVP